jgi:catechol 2,3-dioxygenase-like lactoylglutathione lyase family enzyme
MSKFSVAMLVCSDLTRSRDFYNRVMGLRIVTDSAPHWVEFELAPGVTFGLHPRTELLAVRPGSLQLGFSVDNVDRFVADCAAMQVPILQYPYEESFGRVAIIADPDGYPIQIGTPKRPSTPG